MTHAALAPWLAMTPVPHYYGVPGLAVSYHPIVDHWADVNLVPRFLARKVAEVESGYDPKARSKEWRKVGRVWKPGKVLARGLFQIAVKYQNHHARNAGMVPSSFRWDDTSDSSRVGLHVLKCLLERYDGDQLLAVAAFNAGYARIESSKPIPRETVMHIEKVFGRLTNG